MTAQDEQITVDGRVKWFDPVRGFGFVVAEGMESDILLHANTLLAFGRSSVAPDADIRLTALQGPRGFQAVEILDIGQPPSDETATVLSSEPRLSPEELEELPIEPARCKWFSPTRGFGFVNIFGRRADVFLHVEVLRRAGLATLAPGEAIAMRCVEGTRGPMVAQILGWEEIEEVDEDDEDDA